MHLGPQAPSGEVTQAELSAGLAKTNINSDALATLDTPFAAPMVRRCGRLSLCGCWHCDVLEDVVSLSVCDFRLKSFETRR